MGFIFVVARYNFPRAHECSASRPYITAKQTCLQCQLHICDCRHLAKVAKVSSPSWRTEWLAIRVPFSLRLCPPFRPGLFFFRFLFPRREPGGTYDIAAIRFVPTHRAGFWTSWKKQNGDLDTVSFLNCNGQRAASRI
ncbi:hypothetical protein KM043_003679 [Ampulex compressa]|nr:hypothetical protein KM043_003679 [Ampulex compressa]